MFCNMLSKLFGKKEKKIELEDEKKPIEKA
jgi:hypothetical protein